jgi:hypothetical protein
MDNAETMPHAAPACAALSQPNARNAGGPASTAAVLKTRDMTRHPHDEGTASKGQRRAADDTRGAPGGMTRMALRGL